ncbi:class I SAM-dependent methyltransferase [Christensenellaceae bacterium NSJ-44]|uniref:Class I SAM-dependent methyltransferase n=1 Tax=Luoshenia tenuis TaxID=2763654 RepID=A0A926CYD1_9FIRM|nr:class I SAM-dependent methyltransferase [Luoshenia tenuis]MBC8527876.1 class I SAM-dependent methyltransferase [Luoshenia tenuis]
MGDHPTFEGKAACYAAGRKGYAQEVYDFIASQAPAGEYPVAADMGSGTGLFAQGLLERGYAVLGVEPLAQMREMAQDRLGSMVRYRAIPQSAEQTGLDSGSIDLITAASAFHWFDWDRVRREWARILRPGGKVFVIQNYRVYEDELTKAQHAVCARYGKHFTSLNHGYEKVASGCEMFFADKPTRVDIAFDQIYTAEQFIARGLSSSYAPAPGEDGYEGYREGLQRSFERFEEGGRVTMRNRTAIWCGTL